MTGEGAIGRTRISWRSLRRPAVAEAGASESEPLALRPHDVERAVRDRLYGSERSELLAVRPLGEPAPTVRLGEEPFGRPQDHPTPAY